MSPIHVLHGQPTPEELATVLAVVSARAAAAAAAADAARQASGPANQWNDRASLLRPALRPGAHAWRTSSWAR